MNEMNEKLSRRTFGKFVVGAGAAAAGAALLVACGKSQPATATFACTDTAGLDEAGVGTRIDNEYTDHTPIPAKHCSNCVLFVPAAADACGTCQVVKGPIHPGGYCKLWAAKPV